MWEWFTQFVFNAGRTFDRILWGSFQNVFMFLLLFWWFAFGHYLLKSYITVEFVASWHSLPSMKSTVTGWRSESLTTGSEMFTISYPWPYIISWHLTSRKIKIRYTQVSKSKKVDLYNNISNSCKTFIWSSGYNHIQTVFGIFYCSLPQFRIPFMTPLGNQGKVGDGCGTLRFKLFIADSALQHFMM